jgi:hypothetical protein
MQRSKILLTLFLGIAVILSACQSQEATREAQPSPTPQNAETQSAISSPAPAASASAETSPAVTAAATQETQSALTWPLLTNEAPAPVQGEELLFSLLKRVGESYQNMGVYRVNPQSGESGLILGEGYRLQAISPDGKWLLANQGMNLYLSPRDGSQPALLSRSFSEQSINPALWIADGSGVLWLEEAGEGKLVMTADPLSGQIQAAAGLFQDQAAQILASPAAERIAWLKGVCNSGNYCKGELFLSPISGSGGSSWGTVINPAMDASLTRLAYLEQGETQAMLFIRLDGSAMENTQLEIGEDIPVDYEWSADGQALYVLSQIRSEYSGRNYGNSISVYRAPKWEPEHLGELEGLNARMTLSADGKHLLLSATRPVEAGGYEVQVSILDLTDNTLRIVNLSLETQMEEYVYIPRIWE